MKAKPIVFAALASLFASCAEGTVETSGGETAGGIGFTTHLTRGTGIDNAAGVAAAGGFDVWAYEHTGPWASAGDKIILIDNTGRGYAHVEGDAQGMVWNYGQPQAWPYGEKKVSFFACAPHGCADWGGTTDTDGVPVVSYAVPAAAAVQADLMVAAQVLDATGPGPVPEIFHHALSRITFSALKSAAMTGYDVAVKGVVFKNVRYSGSLTLRIPVSWGLDDAVGEQEVSVVEGELLDTALGLAQTNITAPGAEMLLMPQSFGPSARIVVTFTVDGVGLSWSGPIPQTGWQAGKSYDYKLLIDGETVMVTCGSLEPAVPGEWGEY